MTDWRRIGRAPDLFERKLKDEILNEGIAEDAEGFGYGCIRLRPHGLDHPSPLGIGGMRREGVGIGCRVINEEDADVAV
jgi:hypothetical protein